MSKVPRSGISNPQNLVPKSKRAQKYAASLKSLVVGPPCPMLLTLGFRSLANTTAS